MDGDASQRTESREILFLKADLHFIGMRGTGSVRRRVCAFMMKTELAFSTT